MVFIFYLVGFPASMWAKLPSICGGTQNMAGGTDLGRQGVGSNEFGECPGAELIPALVYSLKMYR